jgi:NAD(P)-dependent dehydrogenase (short-subunit alcohol dehydrogenase family)
MPGRVWFITGTSRGFGREWATAALERGDRVAAAARDVGTLKDLTTKYGDRLLPLALDVNDRQAAFAAVEQARAKFGRLDVVVNNAGYGLFGMVEEISEQQARAQMETNFFGALWVTQAVLPILRAQKSGHILQVSSVGGITAFPGLGLYHASKWALEGMSQALAGELAPFGVHLTLIEPGGFQTDWAGPSAKHAAPKSEYDVVKAQLAETRKTITPKRGDPTATAKAIFAVVDAPKPPLRIFLGEAPLRLAKADYAKRLELWEQWNEVSLSAQGT